MDPIFIFQYNIILAKFSLEQINNKFELLINFPLHPLPTPISARKYGGIITDDPFTSILAKYIWSVSTIG